MSSGPYATASQARTLAAKDADLTVAARCGDAEPPKLVPVCARGAREASPIDLPSQAKAAALVGSAELTEDKVDSVEANLRAFVGKRILSTKGSKAAGPLFDRTRAARRAALAASSSVRRARSPQGTDADIERASTESRDVAASVVQLETDVRAYVEDPVNVDGPAEARERARIEVAEAARRRKAEAAEEAARRTDDAKAAARARDEKTEAARAAAEAARQAAEAKRAAEAADAEAKRTADADAARSAAAALAATADAKKRADADAKDRARRDAEAAALAAATARQAAEAQKATAAEAGLRQKIDRDANEAEARLRSDLDTCSQSIATLTMVEMSSRGQTKVSDAKVSIQNQKDKLRALLGRLSTAKSRVPMKAAAEETAQVNEESKTLAKETARLVASAKALKN